METVKTQTLSSQLIFPYIKNLQYFALLQVSVALKTFKFKISFCKNVFHVVDRTLHVNI